MANIGANTYDESKNYVKLLFQLGKDILPSELNEWQDILRVMVARYVKSTLGNGTRDDGLKVIATVATDNSVTFKVGFYNFEGGQVRLVADVVIDSANYLPSPQTPAVNRTDYAYVKLFEGEVGADEDPSIIPFPALGEETTRRRKLKTEYFVNTTVPASEAAELWEGGVKYITVASIARLAGVAQITNPIITDLRDTIGYLDATLFDVDHVANPLSPYAGYHEKVTAKVGFDVDHIFDSASDQGPVFSNIGAGNLRIKIEGAVASLDFPAAGLVTYNTTHTGGTLVYRFPTGTVVNLHLQDAASVITNAGAYNGTGNIKSSSGDIVAEVGDIVAYVGNIIARAGDIVAGTVGPGVIENLDGNVEASDDVVAVGGNIVALAGNISTLTGNVTSANDVVATNDVVAQMGNVVASLGDVRAVAGDIEAIAGDLLATAGNIEATLGNVTAGNRMQAEDLLRLFAAATNYWSASITTLIQKMDSLAVEWGLVTPIPSIEAEVSGGVIFRSSSFEVWDGSSVQVFASDQGNGEVHLYAPNIYGTRGRSVSHGGSAACLASEFDDYVVGTPSIPGDAVAQVLAIPAAALFSMANGENSQWVLQGSGGYIYTSTATSPIGVSIPLFMLPNGAYIDKIEAYFRRTTATSLAWTVDFNRVNMTTGTFLNIASVSDPASGTGFMTQEVDDPDTGFDMNETEALWLRLSNFEWDGGGTASDNRFYGVAIFYKINRFNNQANTW